MLKIISFTDISKNSDLFYGQFQLRHREFMQRQHYDVRLVWSTSCFLSVSQIDPIHLCVVTSWDEVGCKLLIFFEFMRPA